MKKLNDKHPEKSFVISVGETVPIPANFLTQAFDLFEINKTFCGSILVVLLESLVCTYNVGRENPLNEERSKNFYRWLDTISPVECDAVTANLSGEPSKLWMQVLNANERAGTSHIYNRKVSYIFDRIEIAIEKFQIDSQHQISSSLEIYTTKVAEGVDI